MEQVETRPQNRTTEQRLHDHAVALRALIRSHKARGQVTITQNAATTTVTHENVFADSTVILFPASAAAAAELNIYVSSVGDGSFVITHPNAATAGRTWNWIAVGG